MGVSSEGPFSKRMTQTLSWDTVFGLWIPNVHVFVCVFILY